MDENQNCISALVDICRDFLEYLSGLKEKGFISEAEYEKHSKNKIAFIEKMEK